MKRRVFSPRPLPATSTRLSLACWSRAAKRVLEGFHGALEKLASSPGLGRLREDLTSSGLFFYRLWSWFIVYRFEKASLEVARVVHAARDIDTLLREEPSTGQ